MQNVPSLQRVHIIVGQASRTLLLQWKSYLKTVVDVFLMGGDLLNETLKLVSTYLGLALTIFGFIACAMGFGDAVNSSWGTSFAIRGFSELLFGISFMLFGNVLVTLAKK